MKEKEKKSITKTDLIICIILAMGLLLIAGTMQPSHSGEKLRIFSIIVIVACTLGVTVLALKEKQMLFATITPIIVILFLILQEFVSFNTYVIMGLGFILFLGGTIWLIYNIYSNYKHLNK